MTYTSTLAKAGIGTTLSIGATPTPIGELDNIPADLPEWGTAEATNFESTAEEFITTLQKSQEFSVTGNCVPSDAGQTAVLAAYATGALASFTLQLPKLGAQTTAGNKYVFNALVLGCSFKLTPTGKVDFSIKLKTSGGWTPTVGS